METLIDRKTIVLVVVLFTTAALAYYFKISPVIAASGFIALAVLIAVFNAILRRQTVRNPWQSRTGPIRDNELVAMGIRTQVFFRTGQSSFSDDRPEPVDEDIPGGGPLFNSICYRLGQSWQLHDVNVSVWGHWLSASMGLGATILFDLSLNVIDDGWLFVVQPTKEATPGQIRQFVREGHDVIRRIPDVHDLRWFKSDHAFPCGVFHDGEFEQGTPIPCDLDNAREVGT